MNSAGIVSSPANCSPAEKRPTHSGLANGDADRHHAEHHGPTENGAVESPQSIVKDAPVENFRPMKVVVIGAGFSGIYCGVRIPQRLRNVELCIYEKNPDVGGSWYENRYPGCACDIPCE